MNYAVELDRVSRIYAAGNRQIAALRDVTYRFPRGSFTAVVGRSGCGKTTLLNLAGAMDRPTSGEVRILGRNTRDLSDRELTLLRRRGIGFVFQFFNLLPTLTVEENTALPLLLDGRTDAAANTRVRQLLEMVGLADRRRDFPHQLSGGQMQRVAIARALAHEPAVLIADEPTGNLDSATAEPVLALMTELARANNVAVILATHSAEAASLADVVISMRDGAI